MFQEIKPVSGIRTEDRIAEIGWFCDLCGGDTEYLGQLDPGRRSNWAHTKDILLTADRLGFRNILLPTSFVVGQEPLAFAAAIAPMTTDISLLVAIRTGEYDLPMLARSLATLDHLLEGRLTVNIIHSDLPGRQEPAEHRYRRCAETISFLQAAWRAEDRIQWRGEIHGALDLPAAPAKTYQQNGGPLLYFGGISPGARDIFAQYGDVFLMWPEPEESLHATMTDVAARARRFGRSVDFGLRIHVIVRETAEEARRHARRLMSRFDAGQGAVLKYRTQDARSLGVLRQDEFRKEADGDGFLEEILWTDIGRARSGCGAALVGSAEQVVRQINRYMDMGFRSFVFSGYPLKEESEYFAGLVLPHLPNVRLAERLGRRPAITPATPLTNGPLTYA
jgi:alkanesulfonate monooxygenase